MKVPKSMQGTIKHCPRGGQDGLYVKEEQLANFAKSIGNKFIDQVMPLSNDMTRWYVEAVGIFVNENRE